MIKVIIVEDEEFVRMGIRASLVLNHPDIVVIGEARNGADFFDLLETSDGANANIVLLDIILPDMNGIEIARRLKTERPEMKILVVSADNAAETVDQMVSVGIEGFISKQNSGSTILAEAIRSIMQGHDYFGKDIAHIISQICVAKQGSLQISSKFTVQERRIIEYCHEGLTAKEIGERLSITDKSVNWHKSNIFQKLGINNTREMMRYCLKNGIITMER